MSLKALAAATAPKSYGSSTTGVKKSTVWTMAVFSLILYTAASSGDFNPTRTAGSLDTGISFSIL